MHRTQRLVLVRSIENARMEEGAESLRQYSLLRGVLLILAHPTREVRLPKGFAPTSQPRTDIRRVFHQPPKAVGQLRIEPAAPGVPLHIRPHKWTGRHDTQAVALRGFDRPNGQRVGHAATAQRRRHVGLDQHDGVRMTLVAQCRELSTDLGLQAAHVGVITDDELSGGPDANAGHDGIGGGSLAGKVSSMVWSSLSALFIARPRVLGLWPLTNLSNTCANRHR